jgi:hypothetical protein
MVPLLGLAAVRIVDHMKVTRLILCFAALSIGGVSALADTVSVDYIGPSGPVAFGYYVGPYYGTINGEPVTLYCVDFANDVYPGETWQANLTPIDGSSDLSNTRYGGAVGLPDALTLYQEAAWLATQYAANPGAVGDIQATIWQLFDPSAPAPSSDYWLLQAEANYTSLDAGIWDVVTNEGPLTATGQVQEFLVDAPVPEPTSLVLFGTVAFLACALLRRRIRATPSELGSRD